MKAVLFEGIAPNTEYGKIDWKCKYRIHLHTCSGEMVSKRACRRLLRPQLPKSTLCLFLGCCLLISSHIQFLLYEILESSDGEWRRNPRLQGPKCVRGAFSVWLLSLTFTYTVTLWQQIHISPGTRITPQLIMSEVSDTIGIPRRREGENDEQAARGRAKGFEGQVPEMVLPSRSSSAHPVAAGGCAGDRSEHCVPTVRSHQPPGQLQLFTWLLPHLPEKNEALLSPPERP